MNEAERRETIKSTARRCYRCDGLGEVDVWGKDGSLTMKPCPEKCTDGYSCGVEDATWEEMHKLLWERQHERMLEAVTRCRGPYLEGCGGGGCRRCDGHGWYVAVACCKHAEACGCPVHYGRLTSTELFTRAAEIVAAEQETIHEQRVAWRDKETKLFGVVSRLVDAGKRGTPEWKRALAKWETHRATLEEALSLPSE